MKVTALLLTILATAHSCDKWSFKCKKDLFLCGISDFEYGTKYPKDKSVRGSVSQGGDACKELIAATEGSGPTDLKCPNGESISHFNSYCSGSKCVPDSVDTLSCSGGYAGAGGDPHFRTYDGTQYGFHGECDLVMAHSAEKDLDIHIRTKSMGSWSLISNAAVRIGSDVFEFDNTGAHHVNGKPLLLPIFLGNHNVVTKKVSTFQNDRGEDVESQVVVIDLGNKENIKITLVKGMLFVRVNAYFKDSEGMLGSHKVAGMVSRSGEVLGDANAMGDEWQVRDTDKALFREARFPQYPQTCVPPTTGRRMRVSASQKLDAEQACAKVDDFSKQFCIEDILLTGDISFADGYLYSGF